MTTKILLLLMMMVVFACSKNDTIDDPENPESPEYPENPDTQDKPEENKKILSDTTLNFTFAGGEKEVTIYCDEGAYWRIEGEGALWCLLPENPSGYGQTTIKIIIDPYIPSFNVEKYKRETKWTIYIFDKNGLNRRNAELTITQTDSIVFETEQDLINFKAKGQTKVQEQIVVTGKEITSLQKLGNLLTEIDGSLILDCHCLKSLDGLSGLKTISKNLIIETGFMTSLKGLNNLNKIGGDFEINTFAATTYSWTLSNLKSFEGLESLTIIGGDFKINASSEHQSGAIDGLTSFQGLDNLKSIGGNFTIIAESSDGSSLSSLESFKGLESLMTIGGDFKIDARARSFSFSAYSLNALTSFKGLDNLKTIGGNLDIYAFSFSLWDSPHYSLENLESFEGLENLTSIGGKKLNITECKNLNNINALNRVSTLDELSIRYCSKLYDFCVLKNIIQKMNGTFDIAHCGYNPTKYQILNGQCSQTPNR